MTADDPDPVTILERADQAMYQAKRSGANGVALSRRGDDQPRHAPHRTPAAIEHHQQISPPTLLQTLAELGEASTDLIAWEIDVDEPALTIAWSTAIREGLIDCVRSDTLEHHWIYTLTPAGHDRLRALPTKPGPHQPRRSPPPTPN